MIDPRRGIFLLQAGCQTWHQESWFLSCSEQFWMLVLKLWIKNNGSRKKRRFLSLMNVLLLFCRWTACLAEEIWMNLRQKVRRHARVCVGNATRTFSFWTRGCYEKFREVATRNEVGVIKYFELVFENCLPLLTKCRVWSAHNLHLSQVTKLNFTPSKKVSESGRSGSLLWRLLRVHIDGRKKHSWHEHFLRLAKTRLPPRSPPESLKYRRPTVKSRKVSDTALCQVNPIFLVCLGWKSANRHTEHFSEMNQEGSQVLLSSSKGEETENNFPIVESFLLRHWLHGQSRCKEEVGRT